MLFDLSKIVLMLYFNFNAMTYEHQDKINHKRLTCVFRLTQQQVDVGRSDKQKSKVTLKSYSYKLLWF